MKIAILGCGKQKVGGTDKVPVRRLYTSALFQKSLALAEATSDVVYVASAQHHLVTLDEEHAPYNQTLKGWGRRDRMSWGARVASLLVQRHKLYEIIGEKPVLYAHSVTVYAGEDYADPIVCGLGRLQRASSALTLQLSLDTPLAGLQVGQRLAWLNVNLAKVKP